MALPNFFQDRTEQRIASYSFEDIATGTGYSTFYGLITISAGVVSTMLTPNLIYSDNVFLSSGRIALSDAQNVIVQTYNFDTQFNLPRTMKGDIFATIPWAARGGAGATQTDSVRNIVNIYKVEGTTETFIISGASRKRQYNPTNAPSIMHTFIDSVKIPLPNGYHFKRGDKLRINLQQIAFSDNSSNGIRDLFYGADPQGRLTSSKDIDNVTTPTFSSTTFDTSAMAFDVPFRIDL